MPNKSICSLACCIIEFEQRCTEWRACSGAHTHRTHRKFITQTTSVLQISRQIIFKHFSRVAWYAFESESVFLFSLQYILPIFKEVQVEWAQIKHFKHTSANDYADQVLIFFSTQPNVTCINNEILKKKKIPASNVCSCSLRTAAKSVFGD